MQCIESFIEESRALIDKKLKELTSSLKSPLIETTRYSLFGGKRLRPLLSMAAAQTFGARADQILHPACALEMVHTYSLIHDDLPCMDDDEFRRNRPTLHRAFPESLAVLTGDFLLTYAFETLASAPNLSRKQKNLLIVTIAKHAGGYGMIGGQILDMAQKNSSVDLKMLIQMYLKKTGAMIIASLEFGAIVAEQDPKPFKRIGKYLGIAFQIVDDLLDEDGITLLIGREEAKKLSEKLYKKALDLIRSLPKSAPHLEELAYHLVFREM